MTALDSALDALARVPVLLVACDYDGTLAPIVDDPSRAEVDRAASVALRSLAALPGTHAAIISGRALADLAALSGMDGAVHLVGSHGSEFDADFASGLPPEAAELRERVLREMQAISEAHEGTSVEPKPASVALHVRRAAPAVAAAAEAAVLEGPARHEGVYEKRGKRVFELSVLPLDKGSALSTLRRRCGASAVLFLGDDVTDEDAFATLGGPDVGVKVGEGETRAAFRVADTRDVARLLATLCETRDEWLRGSGAVPIESHSLLSDQRTIALVTPSARITWLCLPRIDSSAIFAELVGGPTAGHFSVRPADERPWLGQEYLESSLAVETRWRDLSVVDFLDAGGGRPRQRAGRSDLLRIVSGKGRIVIEFAPRLDFGRMPTRLERRDMGLVVPDAQTPLVLRAPRVEWEILEEGGHETARAEFELGDRPLVLDLRSGTRSLADTQALGPERLEQTNAYWRRWAGALRLPGFAPQQAARSALTLHGLFHGPTGAIAAAATTSLPESLGGTRNWDYRFAWLRDAALAARAMVHLGSQDEALALLDWVLAVVERTGSAAELSPLYTVSGDPVHPDAEIGELAGYRGSRPVRIGNSAAQQVQLDVFGPLVDLVHLLQLKEAPLSREHWRLVESLAEAVVQRWREPDHGIWEVRMQRRHWVHSKVMCWLTLERAIEIAAELADVKRPVWEREREAIRKEVLDQGWSESLGGFGAWFGSAEIDASALHVGLSGFLEPDDRRFAGTIAIVERELLEGPTVRRYRFEDSLPGREGGFLLCTSWLISSYVLVGRHEEARELFERLYALAGPTGLLAEEYDWEEHLALGNHPQAYSHIGLIENAVALSAQAGSTPGAAPASAP